MLQLKSRQLALAKKLKLNHAAILTLDFLRTLAIWRDLRKKINLITNYFIIDTIRPELRLRSGIPDKYLNQALYGEFSQVIDTPNKIKKILQRRYAGRFMIGVGYNTFKEYFGSSALRLQALVSDSIKKMHSEIKGLSAYPGMVKGRVKIILSSADFYKMKKGNILVAPNTRPEYVPIMKLASAMISDEGGITSHTAIVAREYHIPCVVGCQIATVELKDGDKVLVDANTGKVKKI